MTHSESWNEFIEELRTFVLEHHHGFDKLTTGFPNKHTNLLSRVKYTRILRQAQEPFFDKITNQLSGNK